MQRASTLYLKKMKYKIFEQDTLELALQKLSKLNNKILTVIGRDEKFKGILTDGDIRRAIDKSNYFFDMTAQDFMSKNFISVNPDDLASECLNIMAKKKIGCLAVMQDKALIGIINQKDLVKLGI